jgi:hypothetical protein
MPWQPNRTKRYQSSINYMSEGKSSEEGMTDRQKVASIPLYRPSGPDAAETLRMTSRAPVYLEFLSCSCNREKGE